MSTAGAGGALYLCHKTATGNGGWLRIGSSVCESKADDDEGAMNQEMYETLVEIINELGDGAYGVPINEELQKRTGKKVTFTQMYATLSRMEDIGLVQSYPGEATEVRGGRQKLYFRLGPGTPPRQ